MQERITFFFRRNGYSIERVFNTVIEDLHKRGCSIKAYKLPAHKANGLSIIKNLFFTIKNKGDINHITGDTHYISIALFKKKTILTIHDCIMIHRNTGIKRYLLQLFWLKIPVILSNHITVISSNTKREVIKFTGCKEDKISIIYNPVNPNIIFNPKINLNIKPIILHFTGTKHKNTARVIDALSGINVKLMLIGKLLPSIKEKLKNFNGEFHNVFDLSNDEIISQYYSSDIILFPSYFEGFGMPIIEGQAVGRVVITSNIEPMTEIAGDGAHLVNPYDTTSIREGILNVINDHNYRNLLIQKGLVNSKRFSVEKITNEYLSIYNNI